jgi:hypothetical protein
MVDRLGDLQRCVEEVRALHNKLILVIGLPGCGKTALAAEFAARNGVERIAVGAELGSRIATVPRRQRAIGAGETMRQLLDDSGSADLAVLDDIELLFDQSLQLDPLALLKHLARSRCVVAVWPGELRDGRLRYAELGHPEFRDYSLDGIVPFAMEAIQQGAST